MEEDENEEIIPSEQPEINHENNQETTHTPKTSVGHGSSPDNSNKFNKSLLDFITSIKGIDRE